MLTRFFLQRDKSIISLGCASEQSHLQIAGGQIDSLMYGPCSIGYEKARIMRMGWQHSSSYLKGRS